MNETEGVIKYRLAFTPAPLPDWADIAALDHWFRVCREHGLIGQDPGRYLGYAFGNISVRAARGFLISGSQTGGRASLDRSGVSWVRACDSADNRIRARGPIEPSSEAMTHDQVYALSPAIGCVIHVHSAPLWHAAADLGLPVTDPAIGYGTPRMAAAVADLFAAGVPLPGAFSMGGHEDGVVVFGRDADAAGGLLLDLLRRTEAT